MSLRRDRISQKLEQAFSPEHLQVEDESSNHSVPRGAESHFRCEVVSSQFNGLGKLSRHRLVNEALKEEFSSGLHALSLHLYTADEWKDAEPSLSPACASSKHKNSSGS